MPAHRIDRRFTARELWAVLLRNRRLGLDPEARRSERSEALVAASGKSGRFVSRAGDKLDAALDAFGLDVAELVCADFGCNVGGFTDCLLQRGAARVVAVDTGYGALAWTLRQDARVEVMERTNALRCPPPELVDLVAVDVAWTPQSLIIPAAASWLRPGGRIISLLKPHYEIAKTAGRRPHGPLADDTAQQACLDTCRRLAEANTPVRATMCSVLRGKGGNVEFLLLI